MVIKAFVLVLFAVAPALAQIHMRPTDPPMVTAGNESWYLLGEPIQFAGDVYYRTGAAVFFDGNVMVRSGHYNGVPLFMDTTIEPYSVVLVPVRRGLMQPYERRRQGDLVGTTGSRTPGFPVAIAPGSGRGILQAPSAPTQLPLPIGAIGTYTPEPGTVVLESDEPIVPPTHVPQPATAENLGARTARGSTPQTSFTTAALRRAENNDGIWIQFRGEKWVSAGRAVPLRSTELRKIGEYEGYPVFARTSDANLIYLPTRGGLVAPYRIK